MLNILSQIFNQVFLYYVFVFFIFFSAFSFIVGVGLAVRNATMLQFFDFMNKWVSTRKAIKPLDTPHFVEPLLLRQPKRLGIGIILGAAASIFLLMRVDADAILPLFFGPFPYSTARILANFTESFLLVGNGVCLAVGLLVLFFPRLLSRIEAYTDKWYTLRKQTRPLHQMHLGIDRWVLAHPTVSGVTMSILSSGLGLLMYART